MQSIGTYQERRVIWVDLEEYADQLPDNNWVCLTIANKEPPGYDEFEVFTRQCINNNILEFKSQGNFGEVLHDWFDGTMVIMEVMEEYDYIDVMTTGNNTSVLADVFWQCFFVTCLPDTADLNNITIVVIDLDGNNRVKELQTYLEQFRNGWLPSDGNLS